jgi:hypothetical protein
MFCSYYIHIEFKKSIYEVIVMAASNRRDLEEKVISIEELPVDTTRHILSFFGQIGTKDFNYSELAFQDKNTGQIKFPTFYGNLMVLCSYMDRAKLAERIALNLLYHIKVEETLNEAYKNPKSLAIPVKIQDPHGQWIEATPLQAVYAAGDRNPPNASSEAKPFGFVERLGSCFENTAHANKQIEEWNKDFQKATEETMAPYIAAMKTTCQEIIESEEITDDVGWQDVLALPIFLRLIENFKQALTPNPNHVVRSGFLFSMQIFLDLIAIFEANVGNCNVEDENEIPPNLGGWWSIKSDALDTIVYPALQARSQRGDIGIFKKGAGNVAASSTPDRLDFSNDTPSVLSGFGTTHFFGFFGDKLRAESGSLAVAAQCLVGSYGAREIFRNLFQAKTAAIGFTRRQPQGPAPSRRCVIM